MAAPVGALSDKLTPSGSYPETLYSGSPGPGSKDVEVTQGTVASGLSPSQQLGQLENYLQKNAACPSPALYVRINSKWVEDI